MNYQQMPQYQFAQVGAASLREKKPWWINAAIGTGVAAGALALFYAYKKIAIVGSSEAVAVDEAQRELERERNRARELEVSTQVRAEQRADAESGAVNPVQAVINACKTCQEHEARIAVLRSEYLNGLNTTCRKGDQPCYNRRYATFSAGVAAIDASPVYQGKTCAQLAQGVSVDGRVVSCGDVLVSVTRTDTARAPGY